MVDKVVIQPLPQPGQKPWTINPQIEALVEKVNAIVEEINTLLAGGGSGGAVSSVAGRTGDIFLTAADVTETTTRKFLTQAERDRIAAGAGAVASVAGRTGVVVLTKSDVGLGNVDNTTDLDKPVPTAVTQAIAAKANDNAVVKLTGNQTITGIKTFSSPVPIAPATADGHAVQLGTMNTRLNARPRVSWLVRWNGSAWTYDGAVITARPPGMLTGDNIKFSGNPGGTLPSWAANGDEWTQG